MNQTPQRATVFVGSSSEGKEVAGAVQVALQDVADVTLWSQSVFELSSGYLESLTKAIEESDFAVLVLTPDDLTESRDLSSPAPRDNVLFELGLFMGRLGRERCFFIYDKTAGIKLPSDLLGVSAATYQPRQDGNIEAAVGPASFAVQQRIKKSGPLVRPRAGSSVENNSYVESLPSRTSVYLKATELVRGARTRVLDTTWGTDPLMLKGAERLAAEGYLEAKNATISAGIEYKELFTAADTDRRRAYLEEARLLNAAANSYRARLVEGLPHEFPLIDFLVVDGRHVILSFLSEDPVTPGHQFIYARSEMLAGHFAEYFALCLESGHAKDL